MHISTKNTHHFGVVFISLMTCLGGCKTGDASKTKPNLLTKQQGTTALELSDQLAQSYKTTTLLNLFRLDTSITVPIKHLTPCAVEEKAREGEANYPIWRFKYDEANRLVQASTRGAQITLKYNKRGQLLRKQLHKWITSYAYDPTGRLTHMIQEYPDHTKQITRFNYQPKTKQIIATTDHSTRYTIQFDAKLRLVQHATMRWTYGPKTQTIAYSRKPLRRLMSDGEKTIKLQRLSIITGDVAGTTRFVYKNKQLIQSQSEFTTLTFQYQCAGMQSGKKIEP